MKKNLDNAKGLWAEKLSETLWAYRTSHKNNTGETSFPFAFGLEDVIPVESRLPSFRVSHFEERENEEQVHANLDLIKEIREEAMKKEEGYKKKKSYKVL